MKILDHQEIQKILVHMAAQLEALIKARPAPVMIGIHTGGFWIAKALHNLLNLPEPAGELDVSFYRDDFGRIGVPHRVRPSALPFSIENRHVILVDDVLFTGRTARAALNELFDYGRPASVLFAVLAERQGKELPIAPDVVGVHLRPSPGEHIKLFGPDQLELRIIPSPV